MKTLTFCLALIVMSCTLSLGQAQEKVLWSFGSVPNDGINPVSSLIRDSAGNLYGTTNYGGINNAGVAFELTQQPNGMWNEIVLHNFCSQADCADGEFPLGGFVKDVAGNLYGTTQYGGTQTGCQSGRGCGVAFELSPQIDGTWAETVLYNFCSAFDGSICKDGSGPNSQLIFDGSGNLYGTALGSMGGVVFELSPVSNGWTESVLYSFCPSGGNFCPDGSFPMGGVAFDKAGNLYGTTRHGGRFRIGLVFEFSPSGNGWNEKVLMSFYQYGSSVAPVTLDASGNLYSTTLDSVFRLNAKTRTQAMRVFDNANTGANLLAGVLLDSKRSALFGTGSVGGVNDGGTVWEVNPARQLVPLYNFCSLTSCTDGEYPAAGLIEDTSGNLYGTTKLGGTAGNGVVFEITP